MKIKQCNCGLMFECKSVKKKRCSKCDKLFRFESGRRASIKHRLTHKTELKEQRKKYINENRGHCQQVWREYSNRIKDNPQKIIARRCRDRVRSAIRAQRIMKNKRTQELCGCTWCELVTHIEKQFKDGMTWENYNKWHIDHIKPCSSFDLTDPKQLAECFHYTNLQPLWAHDNLSKGIKVSGAPYISHP